MTLSRPWRIALIGTLVGGLVTLLFSLWLARSDGGRDWLLARLIGVLPAGSTLRWESIEGSLSGPLEIRGLHYDYKDNRFDARRLRIDHGFWPLLSGRLQVRTLTLEHAVWVLPVDDAPFEWPRWPDVLPRLDMPLTVAVQELQVRNLQVLRGGESLLRISRIDGGGEIGPGRLSLRDIVLVSDRGVLHLGGSYLPRDNFSTALQGRLALPALADAPAASARFSARGNLSDFRLLLDGHAPAPLALRLQLREGNSRPRWRLDATTTQLRPRQLGIDDASALAFDLHANGVGNAARLQGHVARDGLEVAIRPSRLRLQGDVMVLEPLMLDVPQGALAVVGAVALRGKDKAFNLRLRGKDLRLSGSGAAPAVPVTAGGELRVKGRWSDWRVDGTLDLWRAKQRAQLALSGRGDGNGLELDSLKATTPGGELRGKLKARWEPQLGLELDTRLANFDPGYFLPDYPGSLSGSFSVRATHDARLGWSGDAQLADLRGTLRKRPLTGAGKLTFAGATGDGELSLRIGDSRIEAAGSIGERVDIVAKFLPFELSDLWPDARGRLQGEVTVGGTRSAPAYRADLTGNGLHWQQFEATTLSARGDLPATGEGGDLRVSAQGFAWSGQRFANASLQLFGSLARLRAQAELEGALGKLTAEATAGRIGTGWQGRLARLEVAPQRGAPWRLQSPASYRFANGVAVLENACMTSTAGGSVCAQANGKRASFRGTALPLALAAPWLTDSSMGLHPFGNVDFNGELQRQKSGAWAGDLQLRSPVGGLRIDPQSPRELVGYTNLRIDVRLQQASVLVDASAALADGGSLVGQAQLTGLSATAPLRGELRLDVRQLEWLELLSADLAGPSGQLAGTLTLGGQLDAPTLGGDARLGGFSAELPALGVQLRNGEFNLRGEAGGLARISGRVDSGKGQLQVDGSLDFRDPTSPLELQLRGQDITVADTPELEATISPDLRLRYVQGRLEIRGVVLVPTARIDLERLDQSVSASPDVVVLDPRRSATRSIFRVDTEVELQLGDGVRLRGFGLDGSLAGNLRIRDRPGRAPQATGTLDIAGKYTAYGRALDIKRGRLGYVNSAYDDPSLDILAEHEFEQVTVGVRVRGSALSPQTTISSSPAMPTAEALSWLVLGRPLSSASGSEMQQISASSLALSAGSNLLAQRLGARLGLDSAGVVESRALGSSAFLLGKQLSPRLFVSYGVSLLGTGQVITLKYLLRRGLDISLESGSVETAGALNWRLEK